MKRLFSVILAAVLIVPATSGIRAADEPEPDVVRCANLVYGTPKKTSRCFGEKFLRRVREETNIKADTAFTTVELNSDELFNYPFAVMTGEGIFSLSTRERNNLRRHIERGGFILASAGCSDPAWAGSFEKELREIFPDKELTDIGTDHDLFNTVHRITEISTSHGRIQSLKGIKANGRLALVYSEEGLNDTASVEGCCCCGGNEVKNSLTINVNIFAYALTH